MNRSICFAALAAFGAALSFPGLAQTVKVTPLGGIDGEFSTVIPARVQPNTFSWDPRHRGTR